MVIRNNKTYVVFRGRVPGIYRAWPHCHQQVDGFSGNLYQSYTNFEEARMAWEHFLSQNVAKEILRDHGHYHENDMIVIHGDEDHQFQNQHALDPAENEPNLVIMQDLNQCRPLPHQLRLVDTTTTPRQRPNRIIPNVLIIIAISFLVIFFATFRGLSP